jgi:hypothetical protein
MSTYPPAAKFTNHGCPWALIRRAGDTAGKRPSTRVAFLVDTVVGDDGKAVALRGYIGRNDMTGWTKSLRRVEWSDIVKQWRAMPSEKTIRSIKQRMPKVEQWPPTPAAARLRNSPPINLTHSAAMSACAAPADSTCSIRTRGALLGLSATSTCS